MSSGHFSTAGAYRKDPKTEWAEREKEWQAQERAERWIAGKMVGRTFESQEALATASRGLAAIHYGGVLTVEQTELLNRASRALWCGLAFRVTLLPVEATIAHADGHVCRITFSVAA